MTLDSSPRRGTASDRAYEAIRNAILTRELDVGAPLAEADLAKWLSISRTPVREALSRLLEDGLVAVGRRRQIVVSGVTAENRREVFLVREALERLAVAECCDQMELDEIDELRLLLMRSKRAAAAGDQQQFIEYDEDFHVRLALGAKLPLVAKFIGQIRAFFRLMGVEAVSSESNRADNVIVEHEKIVDAIESRDREAALAAMSRHLSETRRILESAGAAKAPKSRRRAPSTS